MATIKETSGNKKRTYQKATMKTVVIITVSMFQGGCPLSHLNKKMMVDFRPMYFRYPERNARQNMAGFSCQGIR